MRPLDVSVDVVRRAYAALVRRAYAALASGDIDQLEQCFAHDAVWHEPGSNIHSGDRLGWPEIRDEFLALLGPLSSGTLRTEVLDIAVGGGMWWPSIAQQASTTG